MTRCLAVAVLAVVLMCEAACAADIVSRGKANSVIVLGSDAIPAEKTAASELASFIKQISGAQIPVVSRTVSKPGMINIYIGNTAQTKSVLPNFKWNNLVHDGILIKTVGSDLVLAGDRPRGTLYVVYEFLESLGVRFLAPDETVIPRKSTISMPKKDKIYVPKLQYRETTYQRVIRKNPEFCARLRLNGHHHSIPESYGGSYNIIGFVHTFDMILPASVYFEAHPEWYSLKNGRRIGGQIVGQLCLTNPEMKAEFIKQTLNQIRLDPGAGIISVSQNDGSGPCECEKCKAEVQRLGNETDILFQFVNEVAEAVEKEYPAFLVDTLAYSYTRTPSKTVKPRHNVIVRLCTGVDCSQPIDSDLNRACMNDLKAWSKMTDKLFIWDYTVNFGNLHLPFPNHPVLQKNIKTFIANNTIGLHEQGDLYNPDMSMQPLKSYLLARLMWNPSLNQEKLTGEFLKGYYGAAGKYIDEYIKLLEDARAKSGAKLELFALETPYITVDVMLKAFRIFDQAEKAVSGNEKLTNRVKLQRMAMEQVWSHMPIKTREEVAAKAGMDPKKMINEYIERAKATGNIFVSEGVVFSWDEFRFLSTGESAPNTNPVPDRVKNLPATSWHEIELSRVRFAAGAAKMVDDEKAVSGKAIRMDGSSLDWATQFFLCEYDAKDFDKAEIIFSIRCEDAAADGHAFDLGVYDMTGQKRSGPGRSYSLSEIKKEGYNEYSAGEHTLGDGMYIFAAPPGNAKLLKAFYVDRVYLVKSDAL